MIPDAILSKVGLEANECPNWVSNPNDDMLVHLSTYSAIGNVLWKYWLSVIFKVCYHRVNEWRKCENVITTVA